MAKPDAEPPGMPPPTGPASQSARKQAAKGEAGDASREENCLASQDLPEPSEDDIDESLEESFPASDPPSWVPLARLGSPKRKPGG